ncbi:hypothetical protein F5148DRAFT_1286800 [Russula earlei]|uniref:Uncharacterized protein n=1 Tax=Russula earlei TaxID=71964 RepID=A0ACC0U4L3_9AGAM|nr:hypothetical protein F5148DRAFT_1286800 [Russula earlei]
MSTPTALSPLSAIAPASPTAFSPLSVAPSIIASTPSASIITPVLFTSASLVLPTALPPSTTTILDSPNASIAAPLPPPATSTASKDQEGPKPKPKLSHHTPQQKEQQQLPCHHQLSPTGGGVTDKSVHVQDMCTELGKNKKFLQKLGFSEM